MATEAQRLIGISLAKIAQSRCGRGGVSLHKNLLVATVLQKARYIFMEEAYHMVQGHYLHATNKFLEPEIDVTPTVNDDDDNNELDDILNAPVSSIGKDEDSEACDKENNPPDTTGLTYFDLDINRIQSRTLSSTETPPTSSPESVSNNSSSSSNNSSSSSSSNSSQKRRREITEHETEEAVLSILPKRIKADVISTDTSSSSSSDDSDTESLLNDDEFAATSLSENVAREFEELNNNTIQTPPTTTTQQEQMQTGPAMEGIDRITSLVSIFSFGNLTRSVSTPDLCSAQAKDPSSESLPQRTYLAMTV